MDCQTLAKKINLPIEAFELAMKYPWKQEVYQQGKACLHDEQEFLLFCEQQPNKRLFALRFFSRSCERLLFTISKTKYFQSNF